MSNADNPYSPPEDAEQEPIPFPGAVRFTYCVGIASATCLLVFSAAIYFTFSFGSGKFNWLLCSLLIVGYVMGLAAIAVGVLGMFEDIRFIGAALLAIVVVAIWSFFLASLPTMPSIVIMRFASISVN